MRFLYSFLYTCVFLLALPYFLVVGLFRGKYLSSAGQRFGFIPQTSERPSVWVHAVSVGEFLAARPLIKKLREEFGEVPLFVSTTTITGQRLASDLLPQSTFYFPFDWAWCVRKVFQRLRPRLILILETEIWPNFLWEAQRCQVPVVLVNGRLSDQSFSRYRLLRRWLPRFDLCLMQSEEDARRMKALGVAPENVRVMGNLKFDFHPPELPASLRRLISDWKGVSLLWIAGSTMPGEEELIADAFLNLRANFDLKLMLAPRHPERFSEVAKLLSRKGFPFAVRSQGVAKEEPILLLDSMGELAGCYELADVIFIGGTLSDHGGHNPIEPAFFGKAILAGPHYSNFRAVFDEFQRRQAVLISNHLQPAAQELLGSPDRRRQMGLAAEQILQESAGATEIVLQTLREYLHDRQPMELDQKYFVR